MIKILSLVILVVLVSGVYANMQSQNNINNTDINVMNQYNATKELKFIIVGDPHVNSSNASDKGNKRLEQVVSFTNNKNIDFVVFMGDMTDDGTIKSNDMVLDILKDLNKKYYVIAGNHDLFKSSKIFEGYYGPMEHIEYVNGYQLLFVGIYQEKDENGMRLRWSFDFSKADKNVPTLVFIHGPVTDLPMECVHCQIKGKEILEYAKSIGPELEKFNNLIGVYSGHIHFDSNEIINGTRYVTINGLNNIRLGKFLTVVRSSDKVGYSIIKDDKSYYELIKYN